MQAAALPDPSSYYTKKSVILAFFSKLPYYLLSLGIFYLCGSLWRMFSNIISLNSLFSANNFDRLYFIWGRKTKVIWKLCHRGVFFQKSNEEFCEPMSIPAVPTKELITCFQPTTHSSQKQNWLMVLPSTNPWSCLKFSLASCFISWPNGFQFIIFCCCFYSSPD